jgi:hypothetical protein
MNSKLRSLVVSVGIFLVGGVSYSVFRREPPTRDIADLRDAGMFSERVDRWVLCNPEKITTTTRNNLKRNGYGTFRPDTIHRMCRVVFEHHELKGLNLEADGGLLSQPCDAPFVMTPDGGQCVHRELINPSLDVWAGLLADAGIELEDGGQDEENEVDGTLQFRSDDGFRLECNDDTDAGIRELNLLPDGGARHPFPDGGPRPWCNVATRRGRVTPPCVIPDCSLPDGGWDDNGPEVDCRGIGPFGTFPDGLPRWRGCNVGPSQYMTGAACIPVECSVVSGDGIDVLR